MAALATHCSAILSYTSFAPKRGAHIHPRTTSLKRLSQVRASPKPQGSGNKEALLSQEDVKYLLQLGGGSIAGAAAIKYGSILFPEITHPNLAQALFMISAPVVVAVWLLFKRSRLD